MFYFFAKNRTLCKLKRYCQNTNKSNYFKNIVKTLFLTTKVR